MIKDILEISSQQWKEVRAREQEEFNFEAYLL